MRRGEGRLCILLVAPGGSGALAVLSHNAPSVIFPCGADGLRAADFAPSNRPRFFQVGIKGGLVWVAVRAANQSTRTVSETTSLRERSVRPMRRERKHGGARRARGVLR